MKLNWVDHIIEKNLYKTKQIQISNRYHNVSHFTDQIHQLCVSASAMCGQPVQVSVWLIVTTGSTVRQKPNKPQLHH